VTLLSPTTARLLLADTARVQSAGRVPSLVTGVVREGELLWSGGRGSVDGAEPDADVQYRIGSISKTVTAVAVLRLRDAGLLALDDPLERHVPGTPFGDRTIGQLLAHDAGLRAESPGDWWERVEGRAWDELAGHFTRASEVPHGAGRRFHYSNLGYAALGEVLARAHGKPWIEVVTEQVLAPLGMARTTARPDGRAARGWAVHPWADLLQPEPEHDGGAMAAAGQLWSTVADLGRFAGFLLGDGGDLLAPGTPAEMRDPAGVDASSPDWAAYGLGLQVVRVGGHTYAGHSGSMPGFIAGIWIDPEEHTGALLLSNATSGPDGRLSFRQLATLREREPYIAPAWAPLTAVDGEALALTGTWYWGTYGYGVRLTSASELELIPLLGAGRASRFRRGDDGIWRGLVGYHAGEPLRPVRNDIGDVVALDLGSFVYARTPYDPAAPVPGGVDLSGWLPGPT
jgi:CubicO group peptidase (beta-lactamase class C family)